MDKRKQSSEYQLPEFIYCTVLDPQTQRDESGKPIFTTYLVSTETTFPQYSSRTFSVRRRYNDFVWLRNHLERKMEQKGKRLTIAELPGDTVMSWLGPGRFEPDFIESRRKALATFLTSVVNHPWARFEEGLHKFLEKQEFSCSD
eukprot:TRINITY_DN802_c0_g1_i1.p1 TRINITY_DN802_c0_g1~~TRINITY_DN802_c0_g1_i1.p1  ORF type:complete len:145 (-),score=10.67 TRINITY_DN802_c0_g1_i1:125-559(-)